MGTTTTGFCSSFLASAILFVATACNAPNPLYCEQSSDCQQDPRLFCDIDGAIEGIGNNCIEPPANACDSAADCSDIMAPVCSGQGLCAACTEVDDGDAACLARNGSTPACGSSGSCIECTSSNHCGEASEPVCDVSSCVECLDSVDCSGSEGVCDVDARTCVECLDSGDCMDSAAPLCNTETSTCVGCTEHGQCSSQVCDKGTGTCIDPGNVVYTSSSSGSDSAICGTSQAPCATISGGDGSLAKVAGTRTWIHLASGPYAEGVVLDGATVSLVGSSAAVITAPAGFDEAVDILGVTSSVLIDGISIVSDPSDNFYGISCSEGNLTVRDTLVGGASLRGVAVGTSCTALLESVQLQDTGTGLDGSGVFAIRNSTIRQTSRGVGANPGAEVTVENTVIVDNGGHGISTSGARLVARRNRLFRNVGGGIFLAGGDDSIIENNFIASNGSTGLTPLGFATWGGLFVQTTVGSNLVVRFNTLVDNRATDGSDTPSGLYCGVAGVAVSNNIVFGSQPLTPLVAGACSHAYSNIEGGYLGTGNIDMAPNFAAPGSDNYHLVSGSPGIDEADPAATTDVDIDGDARPHNGRADMGADEFVGQ